MKNVLLVACSALMICACSTNTPEKKAQTLIKEHLKATMNDPKSYESVSFGTLDSVFTNVTDEEVYIQHYAEIDRLNKGTDDLSYEATRLRIGGSASDLQEASVKTNEALALLDSAKVHIDAVGKYIDEYTPRFNGWSMVHTCRGNNKLGALVLSTNRFYLDKDLTTVLYSKEE